jgi:hypothetical protein
MKPELVAVADDARRRDFDELGPGRSLVGPGRGLARRGDPRSLSIHPNCINLSICWVDKLMQFGFGAGGGVGDASQTSANDDQGHEGPGRA